MFRLRKKNDQNLLIAHTTKACTFKERVKGLIGKKNLPDKQALWISSCPSIHTFFMSFPIDVLFTDRKFKLVSFYENVPPNRILFGGFKSYNVFEMKAGQLKDHNLKKGEALYVES